MIIWYAVLSLALNYPCKKYQIIYESFYSYLCTCMRNKYSCKSQFVWNVHKQVMLKVISFSVLNIHELVETWLPEARFLNSQTDSQIYTFPDQMIQQFVQILIDSKFQSKLRVLDTDDVKQKTSLFSVQGKSAWFCFMVFCSFVLCHLCLVHKIDAQTPITATLSTFLLHEFIVNVKCRMDESHGKSYICLSCNFLIQYSANATCLTSLNMQEHVTSLWLLWHSYIFPDLYGNSPTC